MVISTEYAPLKTLQYTLSYYTYAGVPITVTTSLECALGEILRRVTELTADLTEFHGDVPLLSAFLRWLDKVPVVVDQLKKQDELVEKTVCDGGLTRKESEELYKLLLREVLTFSSNIESYWDYVARVGLNSGISPTIH